MCLNCSALEMVLQLHQDKKQRQCKEMSGNEARMDMSNIVKWVALFNYNFFFSFPPSFSLNGTLIHTKDKWSEYVVISKRGGRHGMQLIEWIGKVRPGEAYRIWEGPGHIALLIITWKQLRVHLNTSPACLQQITVLWPCRQAPFS